ncbi:hypothetical protein N7495_002159 [Penicillium taxi]|uniref:uncharacterized protein n=1 Tax=Penicillium taxi TaxID=168475 RepID=UPI0025457635|nr:uncharacterized protein N7495_002159 [Penicillium taxi]KAJ5901631.1 hypothetical protein N7495_002159 [Penicillium taxi]
MRVISLFTTLFVALATAADSTTVISYFAASFENYSRLGAYTSTIARVIGIDKYATTYEAQTLLPIGVWNQ